MFIIVLVKAEGEMGGRREEGSSASIATPGPVGHIPHQFSCYQLVLDQWLLSFAECLMAIYHYRKRQ